MIDIQARIDAINQLLKQNTAQSLTYAALECRLSIEHICYDRLQLAHDYISHADLKAWQPKHVIQQIENEANDYAASGFTVSIATKTLELGKEPSCNEDYESFEYVEVGTQVPLHIGRLTKLWNALSNVALHVRLPEEKDAPRSIYGDKGAIRAKVEAALVELESLAKGNLIGTSLGPEISFKCSGCQATIRKKQHLLRNEQIISCIMPDCPESYEANLNDGEVFFARRVQTMTCTVCQKKTGIPPRLLERLRYGESIDVACGECHALFKVSTRFKVEPIER